MKAFCDNYNLTSLIKQPKNPNNLACIDLILSNTPRSFQSTCVIETGLSFDNINCHERELQKIPPSSYQLQVLQKPLK